MAAALLNGPIHWPFFIRVGPQAFRATRRIGQSKLGVKRSVTEVTRHRKDTDSSSRASAQGGLCWETPIAAMTHSLLPTAVRPNYALHQCISERRHITDVSQATPGGRYGAGEPGRWGRVDLRKIGVDSPGSSRTRFLGGMATAM